MASTNFAAHDGGQTTSPLGLVAPDVAVAHLLKMKMDTARLGVYAHVIPGRIGPTSNLSLWTHSLECEGCLPQWFATIINDQNITDLPLVETRHPLQLIVKDSSDKVLCNLTKKFKEYGDYWMHIDKPEAQSDDVTCRCYSWREGRDPALFILYAFLMYLAVFLLYQSVQVVRSSQVWKSFVVRARDLIHGGTINSDLGSVSPRYGSSPPSGGLLAGTLRPNPEGQSLESLLPGQTSAAAAATKKRLQSLDTFRGLSIVVMIFVNYEGGGYWYFHHSAWNGLTVADLVFPWFMFIMGVSMALSMKSMLRRATPRWEIALKVCKRAALLFLLGLMLNSTRTNDLAKLRIPGVLQRFAVTYFLVSALEIFFGRSTESINQSWWYPLRDIIDSWPQWFVMIALLSLHTALTFLLPVPGCPKGYLGPGGRHLGGHYQNCTGGAAGYIDRKVFGDAHLYGHPTCKKIYDTDEPFDPEGLLGCLTATFIVFLGLQAGKIFSTYGHHNQRMKRFAVWCLLCGGVAVVLCKGQKDGGWIPVNKNLWSLSFVLGMASTAFFLLLVLFYVIDVRGWWSGKPLLFPGTNAILLYMGHEILENFFPLRWKAEKDHEMTLFFSCWGATFWTLVAYKLYKKKIFINL